MYVKETGDNKKPLMVLLHGGGVAGWMWKAQEETFKKDWHILIPDLPGHGKSADENYISIEDCADKIMALIREKKANRKVLIIGLSLGAQITVEIMSRNTHLADAAVIQSALVIPMHFTNKIIKPIVRCTYKLIQNKRFAKLQSKQLYIPDDMFEQYYEDSKKISMNNLITIFDSNMYYTLPKAYGNINHPMLILYGSKEKNIMKKSARLLAANPNASVYCAQNTGHGFSLTDTVAFNHIVFNWLHTINFRHNFYSNLFII